MSDSVMFERLGRRRSREGKRRGEQGVRQWGRHAAQGAWGLAPTGGRRPNHVPADRGPAAARAGGAPLFRQWRADAADARAPAVGGRGSEKREARRAWAGPGRKRVGRALMNIMVLDLFKLIQMGSN
jgi:hypothetical protein